MSRVHLTEVKLTPEQAKKEAALFNQIHARAREAAGTDPNHPYNAYLWAINGGLDAVMEEIAKKENASSPLGEGAKE
jgi:hypothetical protein